MATYYDTLKVTPKAGSREIKSAYRKLARKLHPDRNNGSEETARAFAAIAEAYEVLRDPVERAKYDKKLLRARYENSNDSDSIFASSNAHARRWRQMVYEHRYNEIIDRIMAEERRESLARQKIIFPTVALFVSALAVGIFKPQIFANSAMIGKIIVITLFIAGVIHLARRIHEAFDRYTYNFSDLHDSIFDESEAVTKPYSRLTAATFLAAGFFICLGLGVFIGSKIDLVSASIPFMFSARLGPEVVLYPPIFVLFVDLIHSFAFRAEI